MAIDEFYDGKITLKDGKGISQGIRDELGLSADEAKKMGRSVWTEILECVEEQNEQKQIYKGGSDINGSYRKNFKVYHGDVIEFTQEIWNKIVQIVNEALGKNIAKIGTESPENEVSSEQEVVPITEPEVPAIEEVVIETPDPVEEVAKEEVVIETPDPVEVVAKEEVAEESQERGGVQNLEIPELQDSDIPQQKVLSYNGLELPEAKKQFNKPEQFDQTKPESNISDIRLLNEKRIGKQNTNRADRTIHRYRAYTYNSDGYVIKVTKEGKGFELNVNRDFDGTITGYTEIKYNKAGQKVSSISRNANGELEDYKDYEYNENGSISRIIWRDSNGELRYCQDYEYDENGKLIKDTFMSSTDITETIYDENGKAITRIDRNQNGEMSSCEVHEYDENGNMIKALLYSYYEGDCHLTKEEIYDENGKLIKDTFIFSTDMIEYIYDENGKEITYIDRNQNGEINSYEDYEYDENGNKTKTIMRDSSGTLKHYLCYEYGENSKASKITVYNSDGTMDRYVELSYNEDGYPIKEITYYPNNEIKSYADYEYDENGNNTAKVIYNSSGEVDYIIEY